MYIEGQVCVLMSRSGLYVYLKVRYVYRCVGQVCACRCQGEIGMLISRSGMHIDFKVK